MSPNDSGASLQSLKDRVGEFCEARDWDQFHGPKDLAVGVVTEAAELLEHFRFLSEAEASRRLTDSVHRDEVESELADVLIFVIRFGERFGFDLSNAVARQLLVNEQRYPIAVAHGSNLKAKS
jgi:NTP pyrophosphatase (non-canonical NTP hydrolase)